MKAVFPVYLSLDFVSFTRHPFAPTQISAYSDFSLRVLVQAALRSPARSTVDEVAQIYGISRHHLVKIVHGLGRSGYLATQRGIGGGFTLARPPGRPGSFWRSDPSNG